MDAILKSSEVGSITDSEAASWVIMHLCGVEKNLPVSATSFEECSASTDGDWPPEDR